MLIIQYKLAVFVDKFEHYGGAAYGEDRSQ